MSNGEGGGSPQADKPQHQQDSATGGGSGVDGFNFLTSLGGGGIPREIKSQPYQGLGQESSGPESGGSGPKSGGGGPDESDTESGSEGGANEDSDQQVRGESQNEQESNLPAGGDDGEQDGESDHGKHDLDEEKDPERHKYEGEPPPSGDPKNKEETLEEGGNGRLKKKRGSFLGKEWEDIVREQKASSASAVSKGMFLPQGMGGHRLSDGKRPMKSWEQITMESNQLRAHADMLSAWNSEALQAYESRLLKSPGAAGDIARAEQKREDPGAAS